MDVPSRQQPEYQCERQPQLSHVHSDLSVHSTRVHRHVCVPSVFPNPPTQLLPHSVARNLRQQQPPPVAVEVHGPRRPCLGRHADVVRHRLHAAGPEALGDGMLPREELDGPQVLSAKTLFKY